MNFLVRSVVGKLWWTIIGMVAIVLLILTVLLVQFFDRHYYDQQHDHLITLANRIAYVFESYPTQNQALQTAAELAEMSNARLTMIRMHPQEIWNIPRQSGIPQIAEEELLRNENLHSVFRGEVVDIRQQFLTHDQTTPVEYIVVGVPLLVDGRHQGGVFLYQTLDELNSTTNAAQRLILYAAGIAIVLTTVFAFFLSSRITHPLRQMKVAADNMARGDFHSRVSIRSRDEIGDLARAFNRLTAHLNESIQALSQEKEQLSSILRSMVDGVITLDANGKVIVINPQAESILQTWKYEENTTNGKLPRLLLDIYDNVVETETDHVHTVSAQGRSWTIAMAPLYNREAIRGAVAVIRDMTEERRLDKLRKDFVANVSHELRTPLAMLQGYSEALVDDVVDSAEERKELAQIIHDESLRMGRLVNELLDLARMQAGHVELDREQQQLEPVLSRTAHKFGSMVRERDVQFVQHLEPSDTFYFIDADAVEQIFTNLIDNAIRHTPKKGTVTFTLEETKENAVVSVQDTGSGIPAEDLPFVFERFYKADKARTRGKAGTGLGLSIAKQLVEAHGGVIQAHSRIGEGTTFTVQFPRTKTEG